jgi:hypothetical protein
MRSSQKGERAPSPTRRPTLTTSTRSSQPQKIRISTQLPRNPTALSLPQKVLRPPAPIFFAMGRALPPPFFVCSLSCPRFCFRYRWLFSSSSPKGDRPPSRPLGRAISPPVFLRPSPRASRISLYLAAKCKHQGDSLTPTSRAGRGSSLLSRPAAPPAVDSDALRAASCSSANKAIARSPPPLPLSLRRTSSQTSRNGNLYSNRHGALLRHRRKGKRKGGTHGFGTAGTTSVRDGRVLLPPATARLLGRRRR